jgi:hypothetical protein
MWSSGSFRVRMQIELRSCHLWKSRVELWAKLPFVQRNHWLL